MQTKLQIMFKINRKKWEVKFITTK